ncbi:MAG: hypothetical protein RSA01_10460 [Clostridium sp.]|uniref:hypothetical protein n=1 Tax=Clostridium sp. TaxID=1506 RepID=UPI002FC5F74F
MSDLENKYMIYDEKNKAQFIKEIIDYYGFDYVMGLFVSYDFTYTVGEYDTYKEIINWHRSPCFNCLDNTFNFNLVDMVEKGGACKDIFVFSIVNNSNIVILSNELNDEGEFFVKINGNFDIRYMKKSIVGNVCNELRKYGIYDNIRVRACKLYSYETMVNSIIQVKRKEKQKSNVDLSRLN